MPSSFDMVRPMTRLRAGSYDPRATRASAEHLQEPGERRVSPFKLPFSPKGAQRGLRLASVAAGLWLSWAAGYVQGSRTPYDPGAAAAPAQGGSQTPRRTEA